MKHALLERTARKKLINFRLSDDEAAALIERADSSGARSVSEYVRITALTASMRDLQTRDLIRSAESKQPGVKKGQMNSSLWMIAVLELLEDALRSARREIVKE